VSGRGPVLSDGSHTVLLVEDSSTDIDLMLHAFRIHRLLNRVDVVRDGAEAIEYLFGTDRHQGRDIDNLRLVLLDLKLPLVNGLEVLARIKADPRTAKLPVVMLTSSGEDRDRDAAYRMGANSFIVKPIDFDQFIEATAQVGAYWLLLNHPAQAQGQGQGPPATNGRKLKVLIIEDSPTDATLLEYELGRAGYEVFAHRVDSAEQTEAALTEEQWDIIVSDYAMPSFMAVEALEIARRDGRLTPFLVISGYMSDQTIQSVLRSGADDCFNKDDLRRLSARVAELLAARRQGSA
jgi:two-component system response regulator